MKTRLTLLALVSTFSLQPLPLLGQGSLTPPGAPAPTMKSLDQVEARTPITSAGAVTISEPGSYYLTRHITVSSGDGIIIATNNVTLDLNGFTITSTADNAAGAGIWIERGLRNITVANGFIQGGVTKDGTGVYSGRGFAYGIDYFGQPPENVLVSRVAVSGCLNYGIYLGLDNSVVESCTVRTTGNYGIFASTVKQSSAIDCGGVAIWGDQVSDCKGRSTGSGDGVDAFTAQNCHGYSDSGNGISAVTAQNCRGYSSSGVGLFADTALNCYGYSSAGTGVSATAAQNCYGYSLGSGDGVSVHAAQNCYGSSNGSGAGLHATTAQNCCGTSDSGYGVYAYATAIGCYAYSSSGTGLFAYLGNSCVGMTDSGTAHSITYKYNMP